MTENLNVVVVTGNLTRDPELRELPSGAAVCKLRLAVNGRRKDENGEWVDDPNFFDVTVWGARGKACAEHLAKGSPIAVDGRLDWREWQVENGPRRQRIEIIADQVQFLGRSRSPDDDAGEAESEGWKSSDDDVPF